MPQNTVASGRAWLYVKNVGRQGQVGMGFSQPVGVVALPDGVMYVANRGGEQNPSARITKCTVGNTDGKGGEEFLGEFGREGAAYQSNSRGLFEWVTGIDADANGNVYASDEWKNQITIFDADGNVQKQWGEKGDGEGQLNGAAGIAFDADDNLWVVSANTSRIQKFSKDGDYLGGFGVKGNGPEDLEMPSGIAIDQAGDIYIADWGNHRVQKYTAGGTHLRTFGSRGSRSGELNHPLDVTIDNEGDVYVADWLNERVVIYDADARPLAYLEGDATEVSEWGDLSLNANPDMVKARRRVPDLEQQQRTFRMPMGVTFDRANNRLLVCDTLRSRLQVYQKDDDYLDPQFNL